jgi:hypothetical protein
MRREHFLYWPIDEISKFLISICLSENGVIDSELTLEWMQAFDKHTCKKLKYPTQPRQLIIDSHRTHLHDCFITYASDHGIDISGYPPHSTHELQGLDKVCFAPLKKEITKMKDQHRKKTGHPMSKAVFMAKIKEPFDATFTPPIVKAAFSKTGVYPVNSNAISSEVVGPSESQSTNANFGVAQPEEVRALLPLLEYIYEAGSSRINELSTPSKAPWSQRTTTTPVSPSMFNIDPRILTPKTRDLVAKAQKEIEKSNSQVIPQTPQHSRSPSNSDLDLDTCTPEVLWTPVIARIEDTPPSLRAALTRPEQDPATLEEARAQIQDLHDAKERYQLRMQRFKQDRTQKDAMIILQNIRL